MNILKELHKIIEELETKNNLVQANRLHEVFIRVAEEMEKSLLMFLKVSITEHLIFVFQKNMNQVKKDIILKI